LAARSHPVFASVLSLGLTIAAAAGALVASGAAPAANPATIHVARVDSIIHPVSAEFMIHSLDAADRAGASLIVFTLSTPGGLVDSTRDVVTRMLAAKTPVVVFVMPSGARAASAGFILTIAADIAAMAPGTHIGAAHPVVGGGGSGGGGDDKVSDTMAEKMRSDIAAYVRTLAAGRKRNIGLSEEAVNTSRAFTETEAMNAAPALIDLVATDVADLLRKLDGRVVSRFDGTAVTLDTDPATLVTVEMSTRQRILSAIAHPNIAFLLLSLGMLGLVVELWSPGAIFPGVIGAVSLLLALFSLQVLPVNYAGVLLMALGVLLLILEIKVTSYGLLTVAGLVSLVFGGMILMDSPQPELRLDLWFVLPIALAMAGIALVLVRLGVTAQRQPAVTGAAGMIGAPADVITAIEPDRFGQVKFRGEVWRATASEPIAPGARAIITSVDGITLTVRRP
jgi:membrane-bound serine protease (ClpP class)